MSFVQMFTTDERETLVNLAISSHVLPANLRSKMRSRVARDMRVWYALSAVVTLTPYSSAFASRPASAPAACPPTRA